MRSSAGITTIPKGRANSKGAFLGTIIGTVLGIAAYAWWQMRQVPQDNKEVDTGEKTADGKPIIEVTGVGGQDDGVKVKGYALPSSIDEVVFPLTVTVRPNKNLFLDFLVGKNVTFTGKRDEDITVMRDGNDYAEWYPEFVKKVVGAI